MAARTRTVTPRAPLEPEGAFVVQVRADADLQGRLCGRVEHVMSGRSEPFESLAGLLTFIEAHANLGQRPSLRGQRRTRRS